MPTTIVIGSGTRAGVAIVEEVMMNKQTILRRSMAVAFGFALLAGACGSDDSTLATAPDNNGGGASQRDDVVENGNDGDIIDGDEPVSSPDDFDWTRVDVDPDVTNYQLGVIDHALADPADNSSVLVRFVMGATPCEGARVTAVETDTEVVLTLETGLHKNVAAMTCPSGVQDHEMVVALAAPLGDRGLAYNDPQRADDDLVANVDTAQFMGLELAAAGALAEEQGLVWRIAREDNESFALTEDFNPNRLNFEVDDGVVTAVENW